MLQNQCPIQAVQETLPRGRNGYEFCCTLMTFPWCMRPLRSSGRESLSCMKTAVCFSWGLTVSTNKIKVLEVLQCVCGIALRDHLLNDSILIRCNTFSVESQLPSTRLRRLGHTFKLRNCLKSFVWPSQGLPPPRLPLRSSFNDAAVRNCQLRCINRPYKDAQNRPLGKANTCLTGTLLMITLNAVLINIID